MKKLLIALIVLSLAGAGGYWYYTKQKTEDKATVQQAPVSTGDITQQVQATGTLEALRTVQVGSQVSGTVSWLGADFNSIVKENQVIAKLDPQLLQVQVDVQEANIQRQQGDIEQQKVQLENDQKNLERTQAQFDKGLVSPQQLETAKLQVKTREANINSAQKMLVQAEAQLNQAKLNVSYCTIKAPIDGVIVDRKVDVGMTVQSSMTTPQFFTIATDLKTLKLSAGVDEADIGYIRPNMQVTFNVDSYPGSTFVGSVDAVRLNAQTQNNVVTYPVWITVQNPDLRLRPSMTANLRIIVDKAAGVTRVPNQALRFRPTSDMYTWLGMQPPAPGQGRGRGANAVVDAAGRGQNAGVQAAAGAGGRGPTAESGGQQRGDNPQANAAMDGGQTRRRRNQDVQTDQPMGQGVVGDNGQNRQRGQGGQGGQGGGSGQNRQPGQGGQGGFGQGRQSAQGADGQNRQFGQGRGQNGQGGDGAGRGAGGGRGFGAGMPNMTPEQLAQFRQQYGGRGGRGGGQGDPAGQGGGRGNRTPATQMATNAPPITQRDAQKIDDLFAPVSKRIQPGQVWIYDVNNPDPNKKLRQINVRLGLTDGQFSELITSTEPLTPGVTQVVTGVVPPPSALPKPGSNNSIFNQQRGFGPGGFGPGGPGGGPGGPGGGGGGRGGGGGGGRGGD